jgi:hypothetical protein
MIQRVSVDCISSMAFKAGFVPECLSNDNLMINNILTIQLVEKNISERELNGTYCPISNLNFHKISFTCEKFQEKSPRITLA